MDCVVVKLGLVQLTESLTATWSLTTELSVVCVEKLLNVLQRQEGWGQHSCHLVSLLEGSGGRTLD